MTKRYAFLSILRMLALLTATFSSRLGAEPITFRFEGRLWGPAIPTTYLDPPVSVGAEFSGTYTFDMDSAQEGFPHELVFAGPPNGMVLELGPHRFTTDVLRMVVEDDAFHGEYDRYEVRAELYDDSGIEGFESPDIKLLSINWGLSDSTASVLSDSGIPTIPLNLDQWDSNFFHVSGWTRPNLQLLEAFTVFGQVNSLSVVPEPDTLVLAVVALLFAFWVGVCPVCANTDFSFLSTAPRSGSSKGEGCG